MLFVHSSSWPVRAMPTRFRSIHSPSSHRCSPASWSDRNKGSLLLARLTEGRDPGLLAALRNEALPPLVEGSAWSDLGHAKAFLVILGRMVDIPEEKLQQMIAGGESAAIIDAANAANHRSK